MAWPAGRYETAAGGRIRYVAAAGLDHRRARRDATLRALMRTAVLRGREARTFDERERRAPALAAELRVLAGCVWHTLRRRCANGPVMAAHSWGRIQRAMEGRGDHVGDRLERLVEARCQHRQLVDLHAHAVAEEAHPALAEAHEVLAQAGLLGRRLGQLEQRARRRPRPDLLLGPVNS